MAEPKSITRIKHLGRKRLTNRLAKYGLTPIAYLNMLKAQDNKCALCEKQETRKNGLLPRPLSVDHDHVTGEVRALLCASCNTALGYLEKLGAAWFLKAHAYLVYHGSQKAKPRTSVRLAQALAHCLPQAGD